MLIQKRLTGIDFFRGLAVYCVILVHCDEGVITYPSGWIEILSFAGFAVPFFLATAFYIAIYKRVTIGKPYPLYTRLQRLLIPYLTWTVIYISYKVIKYFAAGDLESLLGVFTDPVSLILFGGAGFHLYFLPLLIDGTLFLKVSELWSCKLPKLPVLLVLEALSLIIYQWILISGNAFEPAAGRAFQDLFPQIPDMVFPVSTLVRFGLVTIALVARCVTYILAAMILCNSKIQRILGKSVQHHSYAWLGFFIAINLFGRYFIPEAVLEVAKGYLALISVIALSSKLRSHPLLSSIGTCSFGIYLIHLIFVEIFQIFASRYYPAYENPSSTILLLISALIFSVSWLATHFLAQYKSLSKVLFGA